MRALLAAVLLFGLAQARAADSCEALAKDGFYNTKTITDYDALEKWVKDNWTLNYDQLKSKQTQTQSEGGFSLFDMISLDWDYDRVAKEFEESHLKASRDYEAFKKTEFYRHLLERTASKSLAEAYVDCQRVQANEKTGTTMLYWTSDARQESVTGVMRFIGSQAWDPGSLTLSSVALQNVVLQDPKALSSGVVIDRYTPLLFVAQRGKKCEKGSITVAIKGSGFPQVLDLPALDPPPPPVPVEVKRQIVVPNVLVQQYGFPKISGGDCDMHTNKNDSVDARVTYGVSIRDGKQVVISSSFWTQEHRGDNTTIGGPAPEVIAYTAEEGWRVTAIARPQPLSNVLVSNTRGQAHGTRAWRSNPAPFTSLSYVVDTSQSDDCRSVGFNGLIDVELTVERIDPPVVAAPAPSFCDADSATTP